MKRLLATLLLLSLAHFGRAEESVLAFQAEATPDWLRPLDLTLGTFRPATAEEIFRTPFTLRCESRRVTTEKGNVYAFSDWWIRNELDREVSIATLRPYRPRLPQGRVYGATWLTSSLYSDYPQASDIYDIRVLTMGKWINLVRHPLRNPNYITWKALQPKEEMRIHSAGGKNGHFLNALAMTIPFRIDELAGEAVLHWVGP